MFNLLPLVDTHWVSKSHLGGPSLMNTEDIRAKSAQSRHNEPGILGKNQEVTQEVHG